MLEKKTGYVNNELVHSLDWYPTLMATPEITNTGNNIDGMDLWNTMSKGLPVKVWIFVYDIDTNVPISAIRYNQWKLIVGNPGAPSDWYQPPNSSVHVKDDDLVAETNTTTYLFDLDADRTEHFNLA